MKINETKKAHIDEGPLDLLTKSGRDQRRANKSGKQTVQKTADNLMRQFSEYLGIQGKGKDEIETEDVIRFLQSKNVDVSNIDPNDPMDSKRLKNIFLVKSREAVLAKRGASSKQPPASTSTSSPASSQSNQQPPAPTDNKRTQSAYAQTVQAAKKLSAKEKRRLIAQLQKTLPSAAGSSPSFSSSRNPSTS